MIIIVLILVFLIMLAVIGAAIESRTKRKRRDVLLSTPTPEDAKDTTSS